jgi:sigma-B regulation protein RsbU (phosphoserine phosphatase)
LHPELDYNAFCHCTAQGTGNFYDFIPRDSSRLAVSIGDLPATGETLSITIPCLQALVRGLTAGCQGDIAGLAHELNGTLYLLGPQDLCAPWFYAQIDPLRHELRYVNAGHEPPLLVHKRSGTAHRLERTGAALGLSARGIHRQEIAAMEPGDLLVMFSEGVVDTLDGGRLLDLIFENPHAGAAELTRLIFEESECSPSCPWPEEDRTLAVVRVMEACQRPLLEDRAEAGLMVCAA